MSDPLLYLVMVDHYRVDSASFDVYELQEHGGNHSFASTSLLPDLLALDDIKEVRRRLPQCRIVFTRMMDRCDVRVVIGSEANSYGARVGDKVPIDATNTSWHSVEPVKEN